MIKKVRYPTVEDVRPIALLDVSQKLYLTFLRGDIEEHIKRNHLERNNQIGFTGGGRLEYGHFLLQHMVEEAWRKKGRVKMVVMALDFSKAFDSVDRKKLVETMISYKINPLVINLIAKLYSGDETILTIGGKEVRLKLNAGIRQGCPASALLFKIVTYEIMKRLEEVGVKFETTRYSLNSIFYADDSIVVARTVEEARRNLAVIKEASKVFGLEINERKSKVMIFRTRGRGGRDDEIPEAGTVEGMEVVRSLKYLGICINDRRDIFKKHKVELVDKAEKMALQTYSMIERCCSRVVIGKTFWKTIVLPSVLTGIGLMTLTYKQRTKLQQIEDGVFRKILGARKFAPLEVLRGEVGSSSMQSRLIQSKLLLVKSIMDGQNELMKEALEGVRENEFDKMNIGITSCLRKVGIEYERLRQMSKEEIKRKVRDRDDEVWLNGLREKVTVDLYLEYKGKIQEARVYDNSLKSDLFFAARSNTMELNELRARWRKGEPTCDLCGAEREDLMHFILKCRPLEGKRRGVIEKFRSDCDRDTLGALLFGTEGEDCEEVKSMMWDLWVERQRKLGVRWMGRG